MLHVDFSRRLARASFQSRISEGPGPALTYRLMDGSGYIRLDREEWAQIGDYFARETRPSVVRAYVGLILTLPAFVLWISMTHVPPLSYLFALLPVSIATCVKIAALPGLPIAVYLRHSNYTQSVVTTIERELTGRPRVKAPPADPERVPLWLDVLTMLLVGPGLVIAVVGETDPTSLENTPFDGAHLGPAALAGVSVIALRLLWPRIRRRRG